MNPLISVIVPVYNAADYLDTCINSLLLQTYQDLEIILVNDGSTDKSGEICDVYAANNQTVKVIHTNNQGVSAARNIGVANAKGDYIGFVDSDDWVEPDMYDKMLKMLLESKADFCVCGLYEEYATGFTAKKTNSNIVDVIDQETALKLIFQNKNFRGYVCNKLFHKSLMDNLLFKTELKLCEDLCYTVQYIAKCHSASFTEQGFYHYRLHEKSATGDLKYHPNKLSLLTAYTNIMPIYKELCPSYLSELNLNYLKAAVNLKGRIKLDRKRYPADAKQLDLIIKENYLSVMQDKSIPILSKSNLFFSICFPGIMLWIKQKILKLKRRGI